MKKILITGGAGFIGTNFIYYTLQNYPKDQIVCLDALTYAGNLENLKKAVQSPQFTFIHGDIANRKKTFNLFEKENFDIVINFAAQTHVDRSIEDSEVFIHTNISGTHVLLDACRTYDVSCFHQVSTDEVYGDLPLNRPDLYFTETDPLNPSSPYAASKASADFLTLAYHRTYHLPVSISRCSNNYGPYQFPEKLIPLMIIQAMKDKSLPVYGNGENVRDWLHVKDHCKAIDLIIRHKQSIGEVYNIGANNERTNIEVVKAILRALNKPDTLITHVADRPGHDLRYALNSSKIFKDLGFKPKVNFEDGLTSVVDWYKTHKGWWKKILNKGSL